MSTAEKLGLTPNEMNLIYDALNGTISELDCLNWKHNEISRLMECNGYYNLAEKWDVNFNEFIVKLDALSEIEMLEILEDAKQFWHIGDEQYHCFGYITPKQKMEKIKPV